MWEVKAEEHEHPHAIGWAACMLLHLVLIIC